MEILLDLFYMFEVKSIVSTNNVPERTNPLQNLWNQSAVQSLYTKNYPNANMNIYFNWYHHYCCYYVLLLFLLLYIYINMCVYYTYTIVYVTDLFYIVLYECIYDRYPPSHMAITPSLYK